MSRTLRAALLGLALLVAAAGATALWVKRAPVARGERRELLLLTSLPLLFGERFSLETPRSPAVERLERTFRLVLIPVADLASLRNHDLLLMAHPRAQPAEYLVELDHWVRSGGRVLLLADPKLDFNSSRPFGDLLRPPPAFADTGLLGHWGVNLEAPDPLDARATAGRLTSRSAACRASSDGLIARCGIGRGRATIFAEADFLIDQEPVLLGRFDGEMAELARR